MRPVTIRIPRDTRFTWHSLPGGGGWVAIDRDCRLWYARQRNERHLSAMRLEDGFSVACADIIDAMGVL